MTLILTSLSFSSKEDLLVLIPFIIIRMTSPCKCFNCSRDACGYCYFCRENNSGVCLFRRCRGMAYAFESQLKWQQDAQQLAKEYPHLKPLYSDVFVAKEYHTRSTGSEQEVSQIVKKSPHFESLYHDANEQPFAYDTSIASEANSHGLVNEKMDDDEKPPVSVISFSPKPSLSTSVPPFVSSLLEDNEGNRPKLNRFSCGTCSQCQLWACNICVHCKSRETSKPKRRCPFMPCEAFPYSMRTLQNLKQRARQALRADPDILGPMYESLYGENGSLTRKQAEKEKEKKTANARTSNKQRSIMLRSKFRQEHEEPLPHSEKPVPVRTLRKRDASTLFSYRDTLATSTYNPSKTRNQQQASRIRASLKLTMTKNGRSPLQSLTDTVLASPLSSSNPCVPTTVSSERRAISKIPASGTKRKRSRACAECAGCTTPNCGLCIHCKGVGYDDRSRCVFRVCHRCNYMPKTKANLAFFIRKSLDYTRRADGSSPLDSMAEPVLSGPLANASSSKGTLDMIGRKQSFSASLMAEHDTSDDLDEDSSRNSKSDSNPHYTSKRLMGYPSPGHSLLKGIDWNDPMGDWKEFIDSLKTLSNFDRETAIFFHYRQANELPVVEGRDKTEILKVERALISSIFLLGGLPSSAKNTVVDKARHAVLVYSLHFENDRRLMVYLTSNINYQMELRQILNDPNMHALEPRDFRKKICSLRTDF